MDNTKTNTILQGDSIEILKTLPDASIHCCVTSPPYYGLRDYGVDGQIGREKSPELYIERLVAVFREVRRVLRHDGTAWLNIADTYCNTKIKASGCKEKDLIGIPWLLAFSLRNDGWYLRNAIIWEKPNAMPESVKDRLTRSYEFVFLLAKSKHYYYDATAIAEPVADGTPARMKRGRGSHKYAEGIPGQRMQKINIPRAIGTISDDELPTTRNKRDVWKIATTHYGGAHFAAYPPKLAETCILAGCPMDGIVLDPFFGSGTTGLVAVQQGRQYIGIDINAEYCKLANERITANTNGGVSV